MGELYIHRGIENVSQAAADKCPLRLIFFVVNFGYKLLHSVRGDAAVFGGGIADIGFENAAEVGGGLKAEPQEIVDMIMYAASDKGAFMTGNTILMDGGRYVMRNKN